MSEENNEGMVDGCKVESWYRKTQDSIESENVKNGKKEKERGGVTTRLWVERVVDGA